MRRQGRVLKGSPQEHANISFFALVLNIPVLVVVVVVHIFPFRVVVVVPNLTIVTNVNFTTTKAQWPIDSMRQESVPP
jgi:hypothetical protein